VSVDSTTGKGWGEVMATGNMRRAERREKYRRITEFIEWQGEMQYTSLTG